MKTLQIFILLIIGFTTINGIPTLKPTPKPAEIKKTLLVEETKIDNPAKPKIAVENAEEPKKADRAKKSASTTFCVEIRPGATDGPHKVCDPPVQPQPEHHDYHEVHDNPPLPINTAEPEYPLFVIPPSPVAIYDSYLQPQQPPSISFLQPQLPSIAYLQPQSPPATILHVPQIQQDPLPIQHLSPTAQIIYPPNINSQCQCPPPPCLSNPWAGISGIHRPHAQLTLYRSSNGSPMGDLVSSSSPDLTMEMKNNENNDGKTLENGKTESSEMQTMSVGPETVGTIFGKSLGKQHGGLYPIYPGLTNGCGQQTGPLIIPQYPQFPSGCGSTIFISSGRQSEEGPGETLSMKNAIGLGSMTMGQSQMSMDMGQARTYSHYPSMPQPIIMPAGGFNSNRMLYQPSSGYQTYQGNYDPYHSQSMITLSGARPMYRNDHHMRQSMQNNEENQKNSQSEQKTSQASNSMSPSKMLNQMRGQESQKTNSMMQSFPRENEDHQMEKGTHINVHIPSAGQTYSSGNGAKNSNDEKNSEISKHEEIGKRAAESPSIDSIET